MGNLNTKKYNNLELTIKSRLSYAEKMNFNEILLQKIQTRIDQEKQLKALKPGLWIAGLIYAGSIILLIFGFIYSAHAFTQTGILKYLNLIFTDFGAVIANWQDFSYSILEKLPLTGAAVLFSTILATAWLTDSGIHRFLKFRKISHANLNPQAL
jgi:hypothetical protein